MTTESKKLEYFVTDEPPILLVSLSGVIAQETRGELESCLAEICSRSSGLYVVFGLQTGFVVEASGLQDFIRLQDEVRKRCKALRFYALDPSLQEFLVARGAVHREEIHSDLLTALRSAGLGRKS